MKLVNVQQVGSSLEYIKILSVETIISVVSVTQIYGRSKG
jgi:hypothetical protein